MSLKDMTLRSTYQFSTVKPLAYSKPSAKAPVIDRGDEAPFLVWGGEGSTRRAAMRCLTEAARLAMIGIDVLYVETGAAHEQQEAATTECTPKQKTTTFLLELPLAVDRGQAARLRAHLC
jgi:hypothetical protein